MQNIIIDLLTELETNGGATVIDNRIVKTPRDTLTVGGAGKSFSQHFSTHEADYDECCYVLQDCFAEYGNTPWGIWLDDHGNMVTDQLTLIPSTQMGRAMELGQLRGETAIFDLSTFTEVRL